MHLWQLLKHTHRCTADVEFSAIVDPNMSLAHQRVTERQQGQFGDKWAGTKVFKDYRELLNSPVYPPPLLPLYCMTVRTEGEQLGHMSLVAYVQGQYSTISPRTSTLDFPQLATVQERPDALFIGLPPSYHGSIDDPKADIELQLAKAGSHGPSPFSVSLWVRR